MKDTHKPPVGPLDLPAAMDHLSHFRSKWTQPVWRHRSGQLQSLADWCVDAAMRGVVRRAGDDGELHDAIYQALSLCDTLHWALNPEASKLLKEEAVPDRAAPDNAHRKWLNITGTVWHHDSPLPKLQEWENRRERKQIVHFPTKCDKAQVILAFDDYVKLPDLHHPWIEWLFLDALVRTEAVMLADENHWTAWDMMDARHQRDPVAKWLLARGDQRRAEAARARAAPGVAALTAILEVYENLGASEGWVISPTRLEEVIARAELTGARFCPTVYVLVDRAVARNPTTWLFEPPGRD